MSVPRSRFIEKSVRARVQAALRPNNEAWKEYTRRKKRVVGQQAGNWLYSILLPFFVLGAWTDKNADLYLLAVGLTFYTLGSAMARAQSLHSRLTQSIDAMVLLPLPITDSAFAGIQWKREFKESLVALLGFGALIVVPLFARTFPGMRGMGWFVACLPLLLWVALITTSALLAAGPALLRFWPLRILLQMIGLIILIAPNHMPAFLVQIPYQALLISPTGWVLYAASAVDTLGRAAPVWMAFAPLVILPAVPWAVMRICAGFHSRELNITGNGTVEVSLEKPAKKTEGSVDELVTAQQPQQRIDATADDLKRIEMALREQGVVEHLRWDELGAFERIVGAWLTPRERAIVDVLEGGKPNWTAQFYFALPCIVAAVCAAIFIPVIGIWVGAMIGFFGINSILIGFGGWPGLQCLPSGGKYCPFYAMYPLGFTEMSRVMLVVNLVRCALHLPLLAIGGAALAWYFNWPAERGALFATMGVALLMAFQPFLVAWRIVHLNSYLGLRVKKMPLLFATLCAIGLMLPGAIYMFAYPGIAVFYGCSAVALVSFIFWFTVRALFNNGNIDLLRNPEDVGVQQ